MIEKTVKATELKLGDYLCYWSSELLKGSHTTEFPDSRPLSGCIKSMAIGASQIGILLDTGRLICIDKEGDRTIEIDEPTPMVSHRGTPETFQGVSID